jgi:hypothetical protein
VLSRRDDWIAFPALIEAWFGNEPRIAETAEAQLRRWLNMAYPPTDNHASLDRARQTLASYAVRLPKEVARRIQFMLALAERGG